MFREGQRSAGAFRPRVRGSGVLVLRGQEEDDEGEERSPNKRHRTTPRPHNIPRPSLDFEKMQQVNVFLNWMKKFHDISTLQLLQKLDKKNS